MHNFSIYSESDSWDSAGFLLFFGLGKPSLLADDDDDDDDDDGAFCNSCSMYSCDAPGTSPSYGSLEPRGEGALYASWEPPGECALYES